MDLKLNYSNTKNSLSINRQRRTQISRTWVYDSEKKTCIRLIYRRKSLDDSQHLKFPNHSSNRCRFIVLCRFILRIEFHERIFRAKNKMDQSDYERRKKRQLAEYRNSFCCDRYIIFNFNGSTKLFTRIVLCLSIISYETAIS